MSRKSSSFRVDRVRADLRGKVWYLTYHEGGKRHRPRIGPSRDLARQMAAQINSADQEPEFLSACDDWQFPVFLTLALTGLRPGELTHLLLPEDLNLESGSLWVRNKPQLGWQVKTRNEREVPLIPELTAVLRQVVAERRSGPVFRRRRFADQPSLPNGHGAAALERELKARIATREAELERPLTRSERLRLARMVWRDAGTIKTEWIRIEFLRMTRRIVLAEFSQEVLHGVGLDVAQRFEFTAVDHTANPAHRQLDVLGRVLSTGEIFLKLLEVIFDAGSFPLCELFLVRIDHPHSATGVGHPAPTHASTSRRRQRMLLPMRTGSIISPLLSRRQTERGEISSISARVDFPTNGGRSMKSVLCS